MNEDDKNSNLSSDRYVITREKVIDMLYEDRELAKAEGRASTSLAVTKLFGDSIGMFRTSVDVNVTPQIRPFGEQDRLALQAFASKTPRVVENYEPDDDE